MPCNTRIIGITHLRLGRVSSLLRGPAVLQKHMLVCADDIIIKLDLWSHGRPIVVLQSNN